MIRSHSAPPFCHLGGPNRRWPPSPQVLGTLSGCGVAEILMLVQVDLEGGRDKPVPPSVNNPCHFRCQPGSGAHCHRYRHGRAPRPDELGVLEENRTSHRHQASPFSGLVGNAFEVVNRPRHFPRNRIFETQPVRSVDNDVSFTTC